MIASVLRPVVSEYVGLVPRVDSCLAATDDALLPFSICELASDRRVLASDLGVEAASGSGRSPAAAATAAVGEAVERYSASYVPFERLVRASAAELGADAVAPERFALFAPWQYAQPAFPFVPFERSTRVPWTRGTALRDGRRVWLPAELVYLGDLGFGGRIGYATSSGAAAAACPEKAILRGLFELLERDAFVLVWRNRLSLPLLDWPRHPKLRRLGERWFEPSGLRFAAIDLSPFHALPSVLAVVRPPGRRAPLGVGADTDATLPAAWWKALAEAFAAQLAARRLGVGRGRLDAEDVVGFDEHILYFADPARAAAADFLDANDERVDPRDVPPLEGAADGSRIRALLERIERAGSSAYAVDVTSPDVAQLGLRVVKTLAPELCPLDASHRARFLGGRRLLEAAHEIGLLPRPLAVEELNPDPHPFP